MSFEILLFGGRNYDRPQTRPIWNQFETAVVLKLRANGELIGRFEYGGGPIDHEVGLSKCFKAASIVGDRIFACTNTEVLAIDPIKLSISERWSHRLFNDVHHVNRIGDHFWVAATGIDSVLELDDKFELVKRYPVAADEVLERFGHDADYRRVKNTKPHAAHPNFIEAWDGEVWVTNFDQCRVESLRSDRKYVVSEFRIHDGVPARDKVWFTSVNGWVIALDPRTGEPERWNLTPMSSAHGDRLLGWCRGIAVVDDRDVLIGFSKLRETKARENLKWIGNKLLGQNFVRSQPTRVARYDLARGHETWRLELDKLGMDAVFSIHTLPT